MRMFVASFLEPDDLAFYDGLVSELVRRGGGLLKPIPRRSAHLTHAFLGEIDSVLSEAIENDLEHALSGKASVEISLEWPTLLRAGRQPRLIMARVLAGADDVIELSRTIVNCLNARPGMTPLPIPKAPHLTLARVRKHAAAGDGHRIAGMLQALKAPARASRINAVQFVQSTLVQEGPVYRTLASVDLTPRATPGSGDPLPGIPDL